MPGQTWRDNGHKALCPLSAGARTSGQNGDKQGSAVSLAPQLDGSLGMSPFKHSEQVSTHLVGTDTRRVLHEELEACAEGAEEEGARQDKTR
eukprot:COSAG02_NODE_1040_length_15035_cov_198.613819_3_plen_92_part_00